MEGRDKAMAFNERELYGRQIKVNEAANRPEGHSARSFTPNGAAPASTPSSTLFLGNLSWGVHDGMLREAFAEYGTILGIRLPTDRETGKAKG